MDLLASYWTLAGPVELHTGREWSRFDVAERVAAAAEAGGLVAYVVEDAAGVAAEQVVGDVHPRRAAQGGCLGLAHRPTSPSGSLPTLAPVAEAR